MKGFHPAVREGTWHLNTEHRAMEGKGTLHSGLDFAPVCLSNNSAVKMWFYQKSYIK